MYLLKNKDKKYHKWKEREYYNLRSNYRRSNGPLRTEDLKKMSAEVQMQYVEKWFELFYKSGIYFNTSNVYMTTFFPHCRTKGPSCNIYVSPGIYVTAVTIVRLHVCYCLLP